MSAASSQRASDLARLLSMGDRADLRFNAAVSLGNLGQTSAPFVNDLARLFTDANPYVRGSAALAVGKIGTTDKELANEIAKLLTDSDDGVRSSAARALGTLGKVAEPHAQAIGTCLADSEVEVCTAAVIALSKLGACAAPFMGGAARLLEDEHHWVRATVLKAFQDLGEKGGAVVAPGIAKLFTHSEADVRIAAAQAMSTTGQHASAFVSDMVKLLADDDTRVCNAAIERLIMLGPNAAKGVPELGRMLQADKPTSRINAYKVLVGIKKFEELPAADRQNFETWNNERMQKK